MGHCCPPPQTLTTEGCFGCIELDDAHGFQKQGIFLAPKGLVDLDKTLVYVCITNNGPAGMRVAVDSQSGPMIQPGQTSTVAAQESVDVALVGNAHHAEGFYVLSYCCPTELGVPKRRRKPKPKKKVRLDSDA